MTSANDPARLRRAVEEAFADVAHPGGPERIQHYPCCPDHDSAAEWLSQRTWQEYAAALGESAPDAPEYSTLEPEAFKYFLPAVLVYLIEHAPRERAWSSRSFEPLDWVTMVFIPLEDRVEDYEDYPAGCAPRTQEEFRVDYVSIFTEAQRNVVVDVLRYVCTVSPRDEDFPENLDRAIREIERAIDAFWAVKSR